MSCLRLEFQLKHLNGIEQTTKLNKFANMTKPTKISNSKAQDLHINKNCQSIFDEEKSHNQKYISSSTGVGVTQHHPFHVGYQSSDKICFTRNTKDALKSVRLQDLITFNSSVMKLYQDTEIEVFVHHPYHLVDSFDKPKYKGSLTSILPQDTAKEDKAIKTLVVKISQIKHLRKRSDSNMPCNMPLFYVYFLFLIKDKECLLKRWNHK